MTIAFLAAISMIFQDILGVIMVQAEASNHGWIAGITDSIQWLFAIATTTFSVTALQGHSVKEKVFVIVGVTIANLIGSQLGVLIGKKIVRNKK